MKKKTILIFIAIFVPLGILIALFFWNKNKKDKEKTADKVAKQKSPEENNTDDLFNDPDTYLENAEKFPRDWLKWYRKQIDKAKKFADGLPEKPRKAWRQFLQYIFEEYGVKKKNKTAWLSGFIEVGDDPAVSIARGALWQIGDHYKKREDPNSKPIKLEHAIKIYKATGGNPEDAGWLFDGRFPLETPDTSRNKALQPMKS